MAKATKMASAEKTGDSELTSGTGAGLPGAPAEADHPPRAEPSTGDQAAADPARASTEPASAEPRGDKPSQPAMVRYQVMAPVFVNGSRFEPQGRKPVYVIAARGLEGRALKLAPEGPAPKDAGAGPSR